METNDYTLVTGGIAKALAEFGCPLTEQQRDVMAGAVAIYILKIENEGLSVLLKNLAYREMLDKA